MAAKAGLDKNDAKKVEDKAAKELQDKAKEEKKKEEKEVELAKNPEMPEKEKVDAKEIATVLAPEEKKEEKIEEEAAVKEEEATKGPEKEDPAKKEKEAELEEGVKEVVDPAKAEQEKAEGEQEIVEQKPEEEKDKLMVDGAHAETETKREIADTFFVASLASLAHVDPNLLEKNCRENGDRTYTVTFYEKDAKAEGGYTEHEITVDPETTGKETEETEGKSKGEGKTDQMLAIITQAYTQWKGGEDKIGEGKSGAAMEALTGKDAEDKLNEEDNAEDMWTTMVEACSWNKPILATTRSEESQAIFSESEVKPWHAYVVMKVKEVNGKRMVTLRNPFGRDGLQEGNLIEFEFDKFQQLYRGVTVGSHLPEKEPEKKKVDSKDKDKKKEKEQDTKKA